MELQQINLPIKLSRDCEGTQIPSGEPISLPAGIGVRITQSLGGSYTVTTDMGHMVRIAGLDADALGLKPTPVPERAWPRSKAPTWTPGSGTCLRTIFDPEIPVNIVDLGLVYLCEATPDEKGGSRVRIEMTLTAPGCGMGDVLRLDAKNKIKAIPGVSDVDVQVVFDPPWERDMMSEAAKLQLGMFDY